MPILLASLILGVEKIAQILSHLIDFFSDLVGFTFDVLLVFLDCFHVLSKLLYLLMLHVQTRLVDF